MKPRGDQFSPKPLGELLSEENQSSATPPEVTDISSVTSGGSSEVTDVFVGLEPAASVTSVSVTSSVTSA